MTETHLFVGDEHYDPRLVLAGQSPSVTATELIRKDFDGNVVARGYRLWDANSEAIRRFQGIELFDFDPSWVLEGVFRPFPTNQRIAFEHVRDNGATRDLSIPGEVEVVVLGDTYQLQVFDDGGGRLLLVFGDATNGADTYPSGRFLLIDGPSSTVAATAEGAGEAAVTAEGAAAVVLDFNRSVIPPCGFSEHFNCPLPSTKNRLRVAVRAGEKRLRPFL